MPLVIISGLPLSGKSTAAATLKKYLEDNLPTGYSVEVISEHDHGCNPQTTFSSADLEKKARGNYISAIERRVTRSNIVIADGLNYIKGYRYQIYCIARAASTPHCMLYCAAREDDVRQRNLQNGLPCYSETILEELLMRYEEPSENARWDSPLFTITSSEQIEGEAMMQILLSTTSRPPSMSTTVKMTNSASLLTDLDRVTSDIADQMMSRVKEVGVPTRVEFRNGQSLLVKKPLATSDMQRLKRQFTAMNRLHQASSSMMMEDLFITYLESNLR